MDSRGSSTIEITIVLAVILLILGVLLASVENTTENLIKTQENENVEMLINEAVDNLINNPGNPEKWNEYEKGTPGLAIINEEGETVPNSVSYEKFNALKRNYNKLITEKIFNSKIKSSMELSPKKSTISSVKIGSNMDSNNVFVVNRLVKCDFYKKYVLKDFENDGKCNRNHQQDSHSCNYFKVFKGNLKNSNYYLIIDDSEKYDLKYIVDTTSEYDLKDWQTAISNVIPLNDKIRFYNDTSAIVFVHLDKEKPKAVMISVPKNFNRDCLNYDYFRTNECEFIFKCCY
ncbi:hypothetical protein TL18_00190 [Methanobrevibacter sp. YE315]|uniref:hypothetical protein n=1 Tax=Methanobrevibacter sp. YE315 TaxID=1609968 RepID=UPI000764E1D8|nr:hypothetical protein [Methanobrevibacter sp. YE315]AMD16591.1 hypothetical protein TL18_00190 [Methanobrevibacter sp. YE315]